MLQLAGVSEAWLVCQSCLWEGVRQWHKQKPSAAHHPGSAAAQSMTLQQTEPGSWPAVCDQSVGVAQSGS